MHIRQWLMDISLGNDLRLYWRLFRLRERTDSRLPADILTFLLNRMAHKRGGYIGANAVLIGDIRIGDNVRIGAGAAVSRDVPDNCTVVGHPVRVIARADQDICQQAPYCRV